MAFTAYGGAPAFPTSTFESNNYWVDINFSGSDGIWLNDVVINNSTINAYGNTTLTFNTYVQLFNTNITIGNDPVSTENIKLNDQVDLNGTSSVVLANNLTTIDATDIGVNTNWRTSYRFSDRVMPMPAREYMQ